jgi:hypothetical protein
MLIFLSSFFLRVKGGFKEVALLSSATDEPVLSSPEIHGPLKIDSSHLFLLVSQHVFNARFCIKPGANVIKLFTALSYAFS